MNDTFFFWNKFTKASVPQCAAEVFKGRTIRKVMWGMGKKPKKKFMKGKMPREKIHAKKKVKKKNSCRRKVQL